MAHAQTAKPAAPLKIGVTLHPYYSWTKNVVGTLPGYEVRALLPGEVDAGDYQPRPEDIKKLADLDAIVVNGIGHDDFILPMIKASGNTRVVDHPRRTSRRRRFSLARGTGVNSHTFISFTNAIQQTYAIQKALAALRPQDAAALQQNAAEYARRLRTIKAKAAPQLADAKITRVVTVHDGYGYLLQEFGLEVAGVVQPAHGLTPSAAELRDMVELLQRERITVVFSEETFPAPLLKVLQRRGGREGLHHHPHRVRPVHGRQVRAGDAEERRDDDPRAGEDDRQEIGEQEKPFSLKTKPPPILLISCRPVEISGLTLRPAGAALVSGFDLDVARGTLHVIVGPNGAGKTTLLSAILGLVAFDGRIVAHWAGSGRIAYVPQSSTSIPRCRSRWRISSRSPASGVRSASASTPAARSGSRCCSIAWGSADSTTARSPCSPAASCGACCSPTRSIPCRSC